MPLNPAAPDTCVRPEPLPESIMKSPWVETHLYLYRPYTYSLLFVNEGNVFIRKQTPHFNPCNYPHTRHPPATQSIGWSHSP